MHVQSAGFALLFVGAGVLLEDLLPNLVVAIAFFVAGAAMIAVGRRDA